MRPRWRKLLKGVGARMVAMMRRMLAFDEDRDRAPGAKSRAKCSRLSRGMTLMRLLPTAAQLLGVRRRAFDGADRIAHVSFSRHGSALLRWVYIRGSGTTGIRRYRSTEGDEKRLRGYTNWYWADAVDGDDGADDRSDCEDDGVFFKNGDAETEGCYAPQETDSARLRELMASSFSILENDDGTYELVILAVAFNAPAALLRAINS